MVKRPTSADFGQAPRRSNFKLLFRLMLLGVLLAGLFFGIQHSRSIYLVITSGLLERDPPTIEVVKPPPGIGLRPVEISVKLHDPGAGVDEVVIRAEQGTKRQEILRKKYPQPLKVSTESFAVNGKELKFSEGQVLFSITAFDRSFWSNSSSHSISFTVDYHIPKLEVLTTQHNAVRGGVELVFYRVLGDPPSISGVTVGSSLYPGFLATRLDPDFSKIPDLYFAFFSIPYGFDATRDSIRVFARDKVGNDSSASIYYRVQERQPSSFQEQIQVVDNQSEIDSVYEAYLRDRVRILGGKEKEFLPAVRDDEIRQRLRQMIPDYYSILEQGLEPLFLRPKLERLWKGKFSLFPGVRGKVQVGDIKEFLSEGVSLGTVTVKGIGFDMEPGKSIRAANTGRVIFADTLGPYGKSVILDHGLGLSSAYHFLGKISCKEGDQLAFNQELGVSGIDQLKKRGYFEFQTRLHGQPVRPEEWWDEQWIEDHIEAKITLVKRLNGISVQEPLKN